MRATVRTYDLFWNNQFKGTIRAGSPERVFELIKEKSEFGHLASAEFAIKAQRVVVATKKAA